MGFFKFLGKKKEKTEAQLSGLEVPLPPPSLRSSNFSSELPSFPGPPLKGDGGLPPLDSSLEKPLFESEIPMPPKPFAPEPPKPSEFPFKPMPPQRPMPQRKQEAPQPPLPELKHLEVPSFDLSKFEINDEIKPEEKPLFEKPFGERPLFGALPQEKPAIEERQPFAKPAMFDKREFKPSPAPATKHEGFVEAENFKLIISSLNQLQYAIQNSESFEKAIDYKERLWKALRNDLEEAQKEIIHIEKSIFE